LEKETQVKRCKNERCKNEEIKILFFNLKKCINFSMNFLPGLKTLTISFRKKMRSHLRNSGSSERHLLGLVQEEVWYWTHGLRASYLFTFRVDFSE